MTYLATHYFLKSENYLFKTRPNNKEDIDIKITKSCSFYFTYYYKTLNCNAFSVFLKESLKFNQI